MAQSLEQFAREHAARAWNLAYALVQNAHDADDIMQQSFIVAARKLPEDAAWPWFAAVIANTSRNTRRRRARNTHEEYMDTQRDVRAADPHAAAEQAELLEQLRDEMAALPEHEREAISLTHLAGLTFAQAAQAAGVPGSTLSDRVQSGLNRLRGRMNKPEPQLLRCVPLLLFPLPMAGLESAVQAWLAGARATVPAVGGPRPRTTMLKPILFAVAAVILLITGAVTLTPRRGPNSNPDSISSARADENAAPGSSARRKISASRSDTSTRGASGDVGAKPAGNTATNENTPKPPAAPATASTTATIRGNCNEISFRNGVRGTRSAPVAGATVWIKLRSATLDEETRPLAEKLDPLKFSTTSAADGSFQIENVPIGAEATVYMAHPAYYCQYTSPLAQVTDYFNLRREDDVPEAVANYRRISDDHLYQGRQNKVAEGSAVDIEVKHGTETVTLEAARGCWVTGRVVGRHGEDVADMRIRAQQSATGYPDQCSLDLKSKADGTYRVGPFLRGAKVRFSAFQGETQNIGVSTVIMPESDEFKYDILMGYPDFESSKGVVRATFKPLNEEQSRIRTLEARHESPYLLTANIDENGVALFSNLERTINWRIYAKDSRGTIVAQSAWFQPTHEGTDIMLEAVTTFSLKVGVSQPAFAESAEYYTTVILAENCYGFMAPMLERLLATMTMGGQSAHASANDRNNLTVNDDGPLVVIAVPRSLLEKLVPGGFTVDRAIMERIWISDVFEGSADHDTEALASHKLRGMTIKGKTPAEESFAARHLVIENVRSPMLTTDANGKFETDWLWPGTYSAYWKPADPETFAYLLDFVKLQGKAGDAVTCDFKEPRHE